MHVLGIPLVKGNSEAIVTASLSTVAPVTNVTEGRIVAFMGGTIEPIIANADQGRSLGISMHINTCSRKLSLVREAELVLVRTDGTAPAIGEAVGYDQATGFISATPTHMLTGRIRSGLQEGKDGITGDIIPDCCLITLNIGSDYDVVPPAAASVSTAKSTKK